MALVTAAQVLEFDGTVDSAGGILSEVLSIDGLFPGLKVIRLGLVGVTARGFSSFSPLF